MMQKSPGDLLRRIQVQLQGVFTGQHGHAVCVVLALELISNRKRHNTHQSCQQNPRHCHALLTNMADIMQETLQSSFLDSYYTHENREKQDDNAGFHEEMFFLCTCKFVSVQPRIDAKLHPAGQGIASWGRGWRMWSAEHARGDNTSWRLLQEKSRRKRKNARRRRHDRRKK